MYFFSLRIFVVYSVYIYMYRCISLHYTNLPCVLICGKNMWLCLSAYYIVYLKSEKLKKICFGIPKQNVMEFIFCLNRAFPIMILPCSHALIIHRLDIRLMYIVSLRFRSFTRVYIFQRLFDLQLASFRHITTCLLVSPS